MSDKFFYTQFLYYFCIFLYNARIYMESQGRSLKNATRNVDWDVLEKVDFDCLSYGSISLGKNCCTSAIAKNIAFFLSFGKKSFIRESFFFWAYCL